MNKIEQEKLNNFLAYYEAPAITEFIYIKKLQDYIARYVGWKTNRKIRRYNRRKIEEKKLRKILTK